MSYLVSKNTPDELLLSSSLGIIDNPYLACTTSTQASVIEDWSFSTTRRSETLWGPHGYHRYPAKFIPQLVRRIIETYSSPNDLVGDPFVGSATTGVEALRAQRRFFGTDINPVAILISRTKCMPLEPRYIAAQWKNLKPRIELIKQIGRNKLSDAEKSTIKNINIARAIGEERINYWFPESHKNVLSNIIEQIILVEDLNIQQFFLCAFSNILRRCSIWLSGSTKPQKDINKVICDPRDEFRKQVQNMINRNEIYWMDVIKAHGNSYLDKSEYNIRQEDARHLSCSSGSLDLLVTSPPYATCYEYSELHQLSQLWLEQYNLLPKFDLSHSWIGSRATDSRDSLPGAKTGSTTADHTLYQLQQLLIRARLGTIRLFFAAFFDADSASFVRCLDGDCSPSAGLN